jgi:lipopolysaccharide export system protein LptC
MNPRTFLVLIAAGGLAALGWWLQAHIRPPERAPTRATAAAPDYYIDDFTATTMDAAGLPRQRLTAATLLHYASDGHADLTRPRMTFFRSEGAPWDARSETGWVSGDNETVKMLGAVHISRAASAVNRAVTVDTRNLLVKPNDDYAETPERAIIRSEGSTLQGIGMRARFNLGQLDLLSQVHGEYVNEKSK